MGIFLLVIGLGFFSVTVPQARDGLKYQKWLKTPCVVTSVKASNDGKSYHLNITYTYSAAGQNFTSTKYSARQNFCDCSSISQKNKIQEKFREGSTAVCYVNPHDASDAILNRSLDCLFPLFFSLLFSGIALFHIIGTWRKGSGRKSARSRSRNRSPFEPAAPGTDPAPQRDFTTPQDSPAKRKSSIDYLPVLIGALFTGIGILIFTLLFRQTFNSAGKWKTTEGTVIISKISTYHTKHGTKSKPYISYAYEVDGVKYENDTYHVGSIFSSTGSTSSIVANHRPGAKTTVYYDAKKPQRSALEVTKKKTFVDYIIFVFPLIFITMGGGVLIAGLKQLFGERTMPWQNAPIAGMKLKRSRDELTGKIIFTILWCSFCTMFTTIWFTQGSGPFSWTWKFWTFDKFFVLIFPAIGVGLIISSIKSAITGAFSGHYSVEISAAALRPGAQMQVNYIFSDPNPKHSKITVLICQTATVRSESSSSRSIHYDSIENEETVYTAQEAASIRQGTFSCTIPPLVEGHSVTWKLVIRYGKTKDTFKLPVFLASRRLRADRP